MSRRTRVMYGFVAALLLASLAACSSDEAPSVATGRGFAFYGMSPDEDYFVYGAATDDADSMDVYVYDVALGQSHELGTDADGEVDVIWRKLAADGSPPTGSPT